VIEIDLPGTGLLRLEKLVLDLNGTIAVDGEVPEAVCARVRRLGDSLTVFLMTADTFGTAGSLATRLAAEVMVLKSGGREAEQKADFLSALGSKSCAALGNGANDVLMLEAAELGVAVIGREGAAVSAVNAADLVVTSPEDALDLFLVPKRLIATLRS
jgi:P-type E1-E2 ATPase